MKKLLPLFLFLIFTNFLEAQYNPMGMRYQAVVRDVDGTIISNEGMTTRIELMTMEDHPQVYYEEVHEINSNEFGILSLTIGEGQAIMGDFENIPWSDQNIWVRTSIKKHGDIRRKSCQNSLYKVRTISFVDDIIVCTNLNLFGICIFNEHR